MNANELANAMQGVISVLNVHHEEDCLFIANEAQFMLRKLQAEIEVYKEALEKLARLGNGDNYGNSIGNDIAIDALRKAQEK